MRRILAAAAVLTLIAVTFTLRKRMPTDPSIEYQGEQIRLNKLYGDFSDYKNDPDNIAHADVAKAQELVESVPIGPEFASRDQMVRAVFAVKFPGYGLGSHGEMPQSDGSVLTLFDVEIPQSGKSRWLVFIGKGAGFSLIDDFAIPEEISIQFARVAGDKLVYTSSQGETVREHQLNNR